MFRQFKFYFVIGVIALTPGILLSAIILVPDDQPTIQAAIDVAAYEGDVILVAPNTYTGAGNRDIVFGGKNVLLKSEEGANVTIIDCENVTRAFNIHSNNYVGQNLIIDGFTITNGSSFKGSAIYITGIGTDPVIRNCKFINSYSTDDYGAALAITYANPLIENCYFFHNASTYGGAIRVYHAGYPTIRGCVFEENVATSFGGAIRFDANGPPSTVENCTFYDNHSPSGSALNFAGTTPVNVHNCIIAFNGGGFAVTGPTIPTMICNDLFGNFGGDFSPPWQSPVGVDGNFSADPLFIDVVNGNLCIESDSPCSPENNECNILIGALRENCETSNPIVNGLYVESSYSNQHCLNHSPQIDWDYFDLYDNPQLQFEVEVGSDDDWTYAKLWDPAPFVSSDTFIVYNGDPLIDGNTYHLRLKVYNGSDWSEWFGTIFRMNSAPAIPEQYYPVSESVVPYMQPYLKVLNSPGLESDIVAYDFELFEDPDAIQSILGGYNINEGYGDTEWMVEIPLNDNEQYFWKTRAFDQYEYSEWSGFESFWINSEESPPAEFYTLLPENDPNGIIYDMFPTFYWSDASYPDPPTTTSYTLIISTDEDFNIVSTAANIVDTSFILPHSLAYGTQYWWKVKATDNTGLFTYSSNIPTFRTWVLGDTDGNWQFDILDIIFMIDFKFKEGPAPVPIIVGDANGDCAVDILDIVHMIDYKFKDGDDLIPACEGV
jgi:predicted outer membrane repeat protein